MSAPTCPVRRTVSPTSSVVQFLQVFGQERVGRLEPEERNVISGTTSLSPSRRMQHDFPIEKFSWRAIISVPISPRHLLGTSCIT